MLRTALVETSSVVPGEYERFAKHLDPVWIEEALLTTGVGTIRRRRLPMEQVVRLVLGMGLMRDLPIAEVVERLELALPDRQANATVAASAIAEARAKLGSAPMEWLFLRSSSQWAHASAREDEWHGLALYGADGSTLRVADSDENRQHFGGQSAGKAGRGESGYPLLRLVALMALRSHLIASVNFGPYAVDERRYAEHLWSEIPPRSLTLVDRGFLQANVLCEITSKGTERYWLTRAKKNSQWRVLKKLGPDDYLVEFTVSSEARRKDPWLPLTFQARAIGYRIPGYASQTLLTSLVDSVTYPADEIRALYHERWELELGYDELKTEQLDRVECIRSKTPAGVRQEVWGILLAYNLVRLEMKDIAEELKVAPTRISFAATLRFLAEEWKWAPITRTPGAIPKRLRTMRDKLRLYVLPQRRSRRVYARVVKIKMSNYALNRRRRRLGGPSAAPRARARRRAR